MISASHSANAPAANRRTWALAAAVASRPAAMSTSMWPCRSVASRPMAGRPSWVASGWPPRRSTATAVCAAIASIVVPLDDESDSDVAVAQVEVIRDALAQGDQVIGVIGHLNSGQTAAAMELYKDMPFVVITPTASEQTLTEQGYTTSSASTPMMPSRRRSMRASWSTTSAPSGSRLSITIPSYGQGLGRFAGPRTGKPRRDRCGQHPGRRGPKPLHAMKSSASARPIADAIFYAGYEIETPYLRARIVEAGLKLPMLASDGAFLGATIDEADGTAEGMYVSAFAPSPAHVADATLVRSVSGRGVSQPRHLFGQRLCRHAGAGRRHPPTPIRSTATASPMRCGPAPLRRCWAI